MSVLQNAQEHVSSVDRYVGETKEIQILNASNREFQTPTVKGGWNNVQPLQLPYAMSCFTLILVQMCQTPVVISPEIETSLPHKNLLKSRQFYDLVSLYQTEVFMTFKQQSQLYLHWHKPKPSHSSTWQLSILPNCFLSPKTFPPDLNTSFYYFSKDMISNLVLVMMETMVD